MAEGAFRSQTVASRHVVVAVVSGRPGARIPTGARDFLFSKSRPDFLWGPLSLVFNRYRTYFTGVKRPGREVHHLPPSKVEVKNYWSYAPYTYAFMAWKGIILPLPFTYEGDE